MRSGQVVARAPGKLFLTGEYAVLTGAPALVAAIDRYARVKATLDGQPGPLHVTSLAEDESQTMAEPASGEVPEGDIGSVVAALRAAVGYQPALSGMAASVTVDSRPFLSGTEKLGLGRSAATMVAAVAAFLHAAGDFDRTVVRAVAVAANVIFQEGWGSGGDVAASVHGGVVEVRRTAGELQVRPRQLPAGVHLVVGWTGSSASTVPLLRRFAARAAAEPLALGALRVVAEQAAAAAAEGDRAGLVAAVDRAADLLAQLGTEVGIPIMTPALARLVDAARRVGAVAKPSGAGGGDCGIALADSPAQVAAVSAAWKAEGITPLSLAIAPEGVSVG